jgi:hypothetical protein
MATVSKVAALGLPLKSTGATPPVAVSVPAVGPAVSVALEPPFTGATGPVDSAGVETVAGGLFRPKGKKFPPFSKVAIMPPITRSSASPMSKSGQLRLIQSILTILTLIIAC